MARRTISYNGTSLQTSSILSSEFIHESTDGQETNYQRLGARDGARLVDATFNVKRITVTGKITGTSIDDLEANIDTLKTLQNLREKNLDIQYASGTRRYKCSIERITIERQHYHNTFAPFEIVFTASNPPFATTLDTATAEYNSITLNSTGTYHGTVTFSGTYRPFPIIRVEINTANNLRNIIFRNVNTNSQISITESFANNDVILINTEDFTVTKNGVSIDYDGVLVDFIQGGNDFRVRFTGNYFNVNVKLIYRPLYL